MKGLSHTTLAETSSRANATPSTSKKKGPGMSTEGAKRLKALDVEAWELNGDVTERFLAANEKEGMVDQELLDLVWHFGAKL